ncbi:unnamed protein product [Protopolystoma xenopodis]|uniref:Cadherin domain-containing protein n=1 Tax=Protopolystoma xenopodis TaxID=117903 RepID=A0A448XC65_9PLAT|nr:unnamed protein product [Protopolystoma xenopodis]
MSSFLFPRHLDTRPILPSSCAVVTGSKTGTTPTGRCESDASIRRRIEPTHPPLLPPRPKVPRPAVMTSLFETRARHPVACTYRRPGASLLGLRDGTRTRSPDFLLSPAPSVLALVNWGSGGVSEDAVEVTKNYGSRPDSISSFSHQCCQCCRYAKQHVSSLLSLTTPSGTRDIPTDDGMKCEEVASRLNGRLWLVIGPSTAVPSALETMACPLRDASSQSSHHRRHYSSACPKAQIPKCPSRLGPEPAKCGHGWVEGGGPTVHVEQIHSRHTRSDALGRTSKACGIGCDQTTSLISLSSIAIRHSPFALLSLPPPTHTHTQSRGRGPSCQIGVFCRNVNSIQLPRQPHNHTTTHLFRPANVPPLKADMADIIHTHTHTHTHTQAYRRSRPKVSRLRLGPLNCRHATGRDVGITRAAGLLLTAKDPDSTARLVYSLAGTLDEMGLQAGYPSYQNSDPIDEAASGTEAMSPPTISTSILLTSTCSLFLFFLSVCGCMCVCTSAAGPFSVDSDGRVHLRERLDFERQSIYRLPVQVSDGAMTALAMLHVHVRDVNDEPPQFDVNPARLVVEENREIGSSIGRVSWSADISVIGNFSFQDNYP